MDKTSLKEVKINFNQGSWNPQKHSIMLQYDPKSPIGFSVKLIGVFEEDTTVTDVTEAKEFLSRFTNKK
jgi:hypothetical protein